MDNHFVRITPTFSKSQEITIENLQNIYDNKDQLVSYIEKVLSPNLSNRDVEGKKLLLKPNWVKHNSNHQDEICL